MEITIKKTIGLQHTLTAIIRVQAFKNQAPYFSVTGEERENGIVTSWGCLHELLVEHFPELAPLIRWHLWSVEGSMHYVANAVYHLGWCGWWDKASIGNFLRSVVWGVLPEERDQRESWFALRDSLMLNHVEGLWNTALGWYASDHFPYLVEYAAEKKSEISSYLLARLPRVLEVMFSDLEVFAQAQGQAPGAITEAMQAPYKES